MFLGTISVVWSFFLKETTRRGGCPTEDIYHRGRQRNKHTWAEDEERYDGEPEGNEGLILMYSY